MLWTGDGRLPTGGSIEPHAFELGFSEAMDPASMTSATATLTPEGGSAVALSVTLGSDGRSAILTGPELAAGTNYALHFDGLKDTSGNALQPEDRMLVVAETEVFEVLTDTVSPLLVAVMDAVDGVYLLFDEAAVVAGGGDLANAVTLTRQGVEVDGETTRVDAKVLKWTPTEATTWLLGAQYGLAGIDVEDLAGNAATVSSMAFAHLTNEADQLLVARQAPTDSYPMAASAYGVTTLFQGRTWFSDLGLYYYRARWYLPDGGVFGERDPMGERALGNLYVPLSDDPANAIDPTGRWPGGHDDKSRIKVKPIFRAVLVKIDPILASAEWTEGEITKQLKEAQRIFSNQANIFLFWDSIRTSSIKLEGIKAAVMEDTVDKMAKSTNAQNGIPVIYFGRLISYDNEGGYSHPLASYGGETDSHRACGVARFYRYVARREHRVVGTGDFDKTPIGVTAHELGHAIGGLYDTGSREVGVGRGVPYGDVMFYPPGKTFVDWEIRQLREYVRGVEYR